MASLDGKVLLEYYLKLYFFELDHREAINGRLAHTTTVLTLLGAALIFFVQHPILGGPQGAYGFWLVLVVIGTLALLAGIVATVLAWWGFRYQFATRPDAVERWRAAMEKEGFDNVAIGGQLFDNVLAQIATVTSHNRQRNRKKSRWAAVGRLAILAAAVAYGLALIPLGLASQDERTATAASQTQKVEGGDE